MCGIAGAVNLKFSNDNIRTSMLHRGPDEQQGFLSGNVQFYHFRLSVLDIEGGKQPMHLDDRYTIIFNGQIYNHQRLRSKYALTGKTHSDTETLLMLYRMKGTSMLDELEGMFAFSIYDAQEQTLFIARDRAGKKPLYYFKDHEKMAFASELNCLKAMVPLEIEPSHFYHYLHLGTFYRTLTPYKNVTELTAGTSLLIDCKNFSVKENRWWNIHDQYLHKQTDDFNTALQKTDHILQEAVKNRIDSSDLEVGCFLSGGIDSGIVTAMAAQHQQLKTFTVSFPGAYDEAPLAKLVADKYATNHTEINISFDHIKNDVEQIIMNYGEPFFDSSAIPSYYVSREAKKYVTVILNGDGADELFGGYRRYVPFAKYDFLKQPPFMRKAARIISSALPPSHDKKSKYNFLYRLAAMASKEDLEIYLSAGLDIIEGYENNIIHPANDYLQMMRDDFREITQSSMSGLQKIMCMDFDCNLFSDLLVKMDIATMANSLEGRSPFLCKDLLEYIPGLPDHYKIKGTTTKYLLRTLAEKYLPSPLIHQPKRGFEVPLRNWVNDDLKPMIFDYLSAGDALWKNFIRPPFLEALMENKVRISEEKRAKILWTIFCMEVWYKKNYLHS